MNSTRKVHKKKKKILRSGDRGVGSKQQRKQIAGERKGRASDDRMLLAVENCTPSVVCGAVPEAF